MKKIILLLTALLAIGAGFSYIGILRSADNNFVINVYVPMSSNESNIVVLAPFGWEFSKYTYNGATLVSNNNSIINLNGTTYSSAVFTFKNSNGLSFTLEVVPNQNSGGVIKVYYISQNSFMRVTKYVTSTQNNLEWIFIVGCIMLMPLIAYKVIERGNKK